MSLLNKANLLLAELACKEDSRFAASGINVEPGRTSVTDGHLLVTCETLKQSVNKYLSDVQTLAGEVATGFRDKWEPFVLSSGDALSLAKTIPVKAHLPVLNSVAVGEERTEEIEVTKPQTSRYSKERTERTEKVKTRHIKLAHFDIDKPESTARVLETKSDVELRFPEVDRVTPNLEEYNIAVNLDLNKLVPMLKTIQAMVKGNKRKGQQNIITLILKEGEIRPDGTLRESAVAMQAVTEQNQKVFGLIMPCKGDEGENGQIALAKRLIKGKRKREL